MTHTYRNPIVFVVVYVAEPGLQLHVAVFETEEDAFKAAIAIIREKAPNYGIDPDFLAARENVLNEWHSLTRFAERIEVFQSPINILGE